MRHTAAFLRVGALVGALALGGGWIASTTSAKAEDEGLYAPAPPAGAAFVRLIDVTNGATPAPTLSAQVDDQKLTVEKAKAVASAYHVVMQGEHAATVGPTPFPFTVFAGRFYSLVAEGPSSAPTLHLLADPTPDNPAKAVLVLYNFTDRDALRLATADGRTTVIAAVGRGASASQPVNPLTVGFGVGEAGGAVLARVAPLALERGQVYGLVAEGAGKALTLHLVKGETARP